MKTFSLISSLAMLILSKNQDGLYTARDQKADATREVGCAPSRMEEIVNCLVGKGYPLIDIYDALYMADPKIREETDQKTKGMQDALRASGYLEAMQGDRKGEQEKGPE